jgi:hypothetical protein
MSDVSTLDSGPMFVHPWPRLSLQSNGLKFFSLVQMLVETTVGLNINHALFLIAHTAGFQVQLTTTNFHNNSRGVLFCIKILFDLFFGKLVIFIISHVVFCVSKENQRRSCPAVCADSTSLPFLRNAWVIKPFQKDAVF